LIKRAKKGERREGEEGEGHIGGTKLNCPSDIGLSAFLPGIFIANVPGDIFTRREWRLVIARAK